MSWWHFGAAGLFLKGVAALTLVSLPDLTPAGPEPAGVPTAVVVRCEPAAADAAPGAPVVCREIEPAR